jgi:hypothetical protein
MVRVKDTNYSTMVAAEALKEETRPGREDGGV